MNTLSKASKPVNKNYLQITKKILQMKHIAIVTTLQYS